MTSADSEQRISRAMAYAQATPFRPSQTVCAGTSFLAVMRLVATGTVIHSMHILAIDADIVSRISPIKDSKLSLNIKNVSQEDGAQIILYNGPAQASAPNSQWYLRLVDDAILNCPEVEKAPKI
jgi:hypothetical protein